MKKLYLIAALLFCSQSFGFQEQLPQKFVCDKSQYCTSDDKEFQQDGWEFGGGFYIKPGVYKFEQATLSGNPNDNFIKEVAFNYVMEDANHYSYHIQYSAYNWFVPANPPGYGGSPVCHSDNISDCYVILLSPGERKK